MKTPSMNKQNSIGIAAFATVILFWILGVYAPELKAQATPEVVTAITGAFSYLIARFKHDPDATKETTT